MCLSLFDCAQPMVPFRFWLIIHRGIFVRIFRSVEYRMNNKLDMFLPLYGYISAEQYFRSADNKAFE